MIMYQEWLQLDGILPTGPYPPCLRMADRARLAGYSRTMELAKKVNPKKYAYSLGTALLFEGGLVYSAQEHRGFITGTLTIGSLSQYQWSNIVKQEWLHRVNELGIIDMNKKWDNKRSECIPCI